MATESNAPAADAAPATVTKVNKPDEALYKESLTKAEKELKASQDALNAIKQKLDLATPNKNKDSQNPTQIRRQELIARLQEIRSQQGIGKKDRTAKQEQIKRLDESLQARITESKAARSKVAFKSVEEIDAQIARLERDVNSGTMKLVDEKKALAEVSSLRKQRKNFASFDDSQKNIDDIKAKIKEIKDSLNTPEAKQLNEEYNKLQAELDGIKAEQDDAFKNLSSLRDQRTKLRQEQEEKYQAVKKIKDEYYSQKKAAIAWEREQREKRRQREQAEREQAAKERRLARAKEMLEEAALPAFTEEIRRAQSLLHFLDPSQPAAEKPALLADKGLGATAQRKVDDAGLKGVRLVRKDEREEDYMPAVSKGKKGKKPKAEKPTAGKLNLNPAVLDDFSFLGVKAIASEEDKPAAIKVIKEKIEDWKAKQKEQTEKNIEKAKKEIERLEAEEAAEAGSPATPKEEDKAVAEVTEAVEKVSVEEEKKTEEAAAPATEA
ncbi:hypothetical protein QBC38DRAFT_354875 [Podospora fimiseda]|uniref:Nuclear segregation protein n=1 Tax=Podospora fimiseda TaxID=252190 RepID=A0AAN7H4Y6_9PEZI|nr:hypothetical protein QBC38DRAFT_354875 [Podospora fimiseda]